MRATLVLCALFACAASAQELLLTQDDAGQTQARLLLVRPGSRLFASAQQGQPGPQWTPLLQGGQPLLRALPSVFDDQQWGQWASAQLQALDPSRTLFGAPRRRPCPRHAAMLAALQGQQQQQQQQGLLEALMGAAAQQLQEAQAQGPRLERLPSGRFDPLALLQQQAALEGSLDEASQTDTLLEGPEEAAEGEQSAEETRAYALEQEAAALEGTDSLEPPLEEVGRTEERYEQPPLWVRAVEEVEEGPRVGPLDPPQPPPEGPLIPSGITLIDFAVSALLALACVVVWGRAMYGLYSWGVELRARQLVSLAAAEKLREPLLESLAPEKPLAKPLGGLLAPIEVARDSVNAKEQYVDFVYVPLKGSA